MHQPEASTNIIFFFCVPLFFLVETETCIESLNPKKSSPFPLLFRSGFLIQVKKQFLSQSVQICCPFTSFNGAVIGQYLSCFVVHYPAEFRAAGSGFVVSEESVVVSLVKPLVFWRS